MSLTLRRKNKKLKKGEKRKEKKKMVGQTGRLVGWSPSCDRASKDGAEDDWLVE